LSFFPSFLLIYVKLDMTTAEQRQRRKKSESKI
jgi:hypothetical protein